MTTRGLRATMNMIDDYVGEEFELINLYNICIQLQQTSSTIEKQNILKQNENNKLFKNVLKFLLDNNIITGISKKKINKYVQIGFYEEESRDYWLSDLLDYVTKNNTGKDKDIAYCQFYISHLTDDEDLQTFIKSIITKSLKLSIDAKTVNKVYGNQFVPTFDVMLGTSIEKCKIPQGTWFSISQKLNGTRCIYKQGKLYTRQGKEYTGLQHILDDIKKLGMSQMVFDGELILKDRSAGDSASFQIGTGIANSDADTKTELKLVIFDMIPTKEFNDGVGNDTYKSRKVCLKNLSEFLEIYKFENIEVVKFFYEGTDQNEIWKWLDYAEKSDMEGIILNLDRPYQCKRTKDLIKVKTFFDIDLKCTGIEVGSGKYSNTLGAIICDYKGNELRVGSGFSDERRDYYWNNPSEIVGKTVTIKYKEETKNKNGGQSLQFPVWIATRFDK